MTGESGDGITPDNGEDRDSPSASRPASRPASRKGRILIAGRAAGSPADGWSGSSGVMAVNAHGASAWTPRSFMVFFGLMATLPMFGQCFHYLIDLPPLYALSKSWPMLTVPLVLFSLTQIRLPYTPLFTAMLVYLVGVTPALSIVQLGNQFDDAWMTTVKVWPFLYYFSTTAVLIILRPTARQLSNALLFLGALTFFAMLALWLLVPAHVYKSDPALSKMFLYDFERGYRIYSPIFFGILFLFYLTRLFLDRPRLWIPLAMGICFILMLTIYKQRTEMAGILAIMGLAVLTSARGWWRTLSWTGTAFAALIIGSILAARLFENANNVLGASLSIRQHSIGLALAYLEVSPWRWLFGVGATTRFGDVRIQDILGGDDSFYLSDIGWIGVIFEYGVIGAGLIIALYIAAWRTAIGKSFSVGADGVSRTGNLNTLSPLQRALGDFILYAILTSLIHSVVFKPGEVMTVMALAAWLRVHQTSPPAQVPPLPSPASGPTIMGRILVPDRKTRTR